MAVLLAAGEAHAVFLYTLSSPNLNGTEPTSFGYINTDNGQYTAIVSPLTSPQTSYRNLAYNPSADNFYTVRRNNTNAELGTLSKTGVFTLIGAQNNIGLSTNVYGLALSPSGVLYGQTVGTNANPSTFVTINTSTGVPTPTVASNYTLASNPPGGRLAYHNGTLYGTIRVGTGVNAAGRFGSIQPTTANPITSVAVNNLYRNMVIASYGSTLYGLFADGTAGSQSLYSIDPATGAPTLLSSITGLPSGDVYFHGASAPVPAPLPIVGAAVAISASKRLKSMSNRLKTQAGPESI